MPILKAGTPEADEALRTIEASHDARNERAFLVADEAIAAVRTRGDAYVAEQIARFDGVSLEATEIRIEPRKVTIDREMAAAIDLAIERIESFHAQQLPASYEWRDGSSVIAHRVTPLRRVGVYVPGGRAVYLSTLIMTAVPARLAGVKEIVAATTATAAARDELHYVCNRLGVREIYRSGGAAAIAAMALGTQSLERVDKIVGPGNAYVTAAKARLIGTVGIDMTAGPTELVVIADDGADASLVAADLMGQAEHGPDSAVICLTTSPQLAAAMPERVIALVVESVDQALEIAARIAPEHLSVHTRDAAAVGNRAENCGAIYCGPASAAAAGDYLIGSNHVLPTGGSARFFSPLGVYDFVKRSNIVTLSDDDLQRIGPAAERLARFEGLPEHAASIALRLERGNR
ncbi:MAG: histidinol dehydrogenase [Thermoanaerobaculia bacterium]